LRLCQFDQWSSWSENEINNIPVREKFDIVVSFNNENGETYRRFRYPNNDVDYDIENKDKVISDHRAGHVAKQQERIDI